MPLTYDSHSGLITPNTVLVSGVINVAVVQIH